MKKKFISMICVICFILSMGVSVQAATYLWPAPGVTYISSYYSAGHPGIDIAATGYHEIVAAREGTVIAAASTSCSHNGNTDFVHSTSSSTCNYGMGNYVQIKHSDGTYATYMHLRYGSVSVSKGQHVSRGDVIGIMGNSGNSTGQHLHFQVGYSSTNTINVNPTVLGYDYSTQSTTQISIYTNPRYKVGNDITITWDYTNDNANNWFVLFNEDGSVYKNYQNQGTNTSITLQNIPEGRYYAYVEWYSSSGVLCNSKSSVFEVTSGTEFNIQDEYYYKDVTIRWGYTVSTANYWLVIYDEQGNVCKRASNLGDTTYYTFDELPIGTYYAHLEWYEGDVLFVEHSEYFTVTNECTPKKTVNFDDSKYILFDTRMSWRAANDYCTSLGGTLVNINSSEENEAIYSLIQNGDREYYWIGCRDNVIEGSWYWTDNTEFWFGDVNGYKVNKRYSNWDSVEPNASWEESDYGCIYKSNGKWDDTYYFFYDMGFVCEIKQTKRKITFNANQGILNDEVVAQRTVNGVNATRNTNHLIVYNDSGATTGTNIYGCEVLINSNHEVTTIINEVGNATVPHNGMILSGHGENQLWLSENVAVGDYVLFDEQNNNIEVYKKDSWYAKNKTCMQSGKYGYLPTPTRENYMFDGWYTSLSGGNKVTADTIVTNDKDHTLYAHWSAVKPNTITTVNNGLFTISPKNVDQGSVIMLILYKDKQFVTMYKATYRGENIPFTVKENYDEAKVLVWESFSNIKPITDAEVIK